MNNKHLKQFIYSGIFSDIENNLAELYDHLERQSILNKTIKIIYGETYDQFGLTIDSLKFYLILHILHSLIGKNSTCDLIIGDIASYRNKMSKEKKEEITKAIKNNISLIKKIIRNFGLNIHPQFMSIVFQKQEFDDKFKQITRLYTEDKSVRKIFERTVLENRLKQETKMNFLYAREEVALIVNYDLKVGPPREKFYDEIASKYSQNQNKTFKGIYTNPTYPLGINFDFFITNPEIEKYGITPYKAGSNKLQINRIIMQNIDKKALHTIIENTFLPEESTLPNPLMDLYIIADLARRISISDYDFPIYSSIGIDKKEILPLLDKYIFSKL